MAEEEKDAGEGNEKPSGGSKKLLIVGLLAGLIVGGGGAAGFFIMQSADETASEPVEVVEEKAPELPDYQYARIDRLNLPLFHKGRVLNYAVMNGSLETIGNEDKLLVVKNVIIIKDALLRYFSVNPVGREDNPRTVDFDKLAAKIKQVANQEVGREIVNRVVISESRNF